MIFLFIFFYLIKFQYHYTTKKQKTKKTYYFPINFESSYGQYLGFKYCVIMIVYKNKTYGCNTAQGNELILCEQRITSFGGALRRPDIKFPPFAGKRERKSRKWSRYKNNHSHTKLARKNCEVSLSLRPVSNESLQNRKWIQHERGDLAFTDIFVRTLSERCTDLWLRPLIRSTTLSSLVHGRWMGVPRSYVFYNFFFIIYYRFIYLCACKVFIINK